MNTMQRRLCKCLFAILCVTCLPGCWDYQRINYRASVMAVGVDPDSEHPDQLQYTVQFPSFEEGGGSEGGSDVGSKGGGKAATQQYNNLSAAAHSFEEAVALMQTKSDKTLFFGNLQVIVVNDKINKTEFNNVIAELMRDPYSDKVAYIVTTTQNAKDFLSSGKEGGAGDTVDRIFSASVRQHGYTVRTHLWEFWRDMISSGASPYCATVEQQAEDVHVFGVNVFRNSELAAQLTPVQTFGFNIVRGKVDNMVLSVPVDGTAPLVLQDVKASSKFGASIDGKQVVLHVNVRGTCTLSQDPSGGHQDVDAGKIETYQKMTEARVQSLVESTLHQLQLARVDPYGFGRKLIMKHPELKPLVDKKWGDMFGNAATDVRAHIVIRSKGALM